MSAVYLSAQNSPVNMVFCAYTWVIVAMVKFRHPLLSFVWRGFQHSFKTRESRKCLKDVSILILILTVPTICIAVGETGSKFTFGNQNEC